MKIEFYLCRIYYAFSLPTVLSCFLTFLYVLLLNRYIQTQPTIGCQKWKWKSLSHVRLFVIVHGILQARILEWVAFPFSRGSFQPRDWTRVSCIQTDSLPTELSGKAWKWKCKWLSHVQLFANLWKIQAMEFSRPENWSG